MRIIGPRHSHQKPGGQYSTAPPARSSKAESRTLPRARRIKRPHVSEIPQVALSDHRHGTTGPYRIRERTTGAGPPRRYVLT